MTAPLARRVARVSPFHVMEVLARAAELEAAGRSVIHMEVGEPDFTTCGPILAAGHEALDAGRTRYTVARGIPPLREAIARFYADRYGVDVDPQRIFITPGATGALQLVASLLLDPGSRVLLTDPGYPCNRHFVTLAGGEPVGIPVGPATHYQLTAALVAQHWTAETRAVLLSSPSNPTGTVVPEAELAAIRDTVNRQGGGLIVDEIYHGLLYDTPESTALSLGDDVFVVNSFSKYFGMTGWRLGWLVVPPEYARPAEILAQNIFISAPSIAQYAAVAAFSPAALEICEQRREAFQARRDFLLPALRQLGFGVPVTPEGAFYIYADCTAFTDDSQPFCVDLLERTGVAFTPGLDFGSHRSHEHVRFAYTNSLANLEIAVERLSQALAEAA